MRGTCGGQVGRLLHIDRSGAQNEVCAAYEPVLQGFVEGQEEFLAEYVAVPVEHDLALVAAQQKGKGGHRVGMVDVYQVVILLPDKAAQPPRHRWGNHSTSELGQGLHGHETAAACGRDALRRSLFYAGAEHIAMYPIGIEAFEKVVHNLFDAPSHGIEFA